MGKFFLRIDLYDAGAKAMVVHQPYRQALIKEKCHVLFKDLPESEDRSDPFEQAVEVIRNTIDLKGCSNAVIFVPARYVCFRNIEFPFSSEKKIGQVLSIELESLLPSAADHYISDFHVLDVPGGSHMILSASIAEKHLQTYFSALDPLSVKPLVISPAGCAAAVEFVKKYPDVSELMFIYIMEEEITLVLVSARRPCAVRAFAADFMDAESIAASIQRTITGFRQRTGISCPFEMIVWGNMDGLTADRIYNALGDNPEDYVTKREAGRGEKEKFERSPEIEDLLLNVFPDKSVKYRFNFCKGAYGTSSFLKQYAGEISIAGIFFLFVFVLFLSRIQIDISSLEKQIDRIDRNAVEIFQATFPGKKRIQDPYLQMRADVKAVLENSVKTENEDRLTTAGDIYMIDVIHELSNRLPPGLEVEIERFLYNNRRLIIGGSTDNFNNVDKIKGRLEESGMFENVSISSAATGKNAGRVNFKFIVEM